MANWPPVEPRGPLRRQPRGPREPGHRLHLRAGLDLQGVHRRRRARGQAGHPGHLVHPAARASRSPTARSPTPRRGPTVTLSVAQILAQSSNVGAVDDRAAGRQRAVQPLDRPLRLRPPDRRRVPRRGAGDRAARCSDYSGSTMGNLPIGQGLSVTPMQMAAGYAAIANGGILRRPQLVEKVDGDARARAARAPHHQPDVAAQLRTMLEGVLAPGGTASEVSVPGYTLAGKTGTAQKVAETAPTRTRSSSPRSSASRRPRTRGSLVAVIVDEPQGGTTTAARSPRRPSARSRGSPCRTWASRRSSARDRPRIGAMRLDELARRSSVALTVIGDAEVEVAGLAYDSRQVAARDALLLRAGGDGRRARFAAGGGRGGGGGAGRRAGVGARRAAGGGRGRAGGDGAGRGAVLRRPDRASCGWSGSPGPTARPPRPSCSARSSRPPGPSAGCWVRSSRWSAASRRRSSARRPEAIDLQATFRRMLDAGDGACAWRSPRTRWRCTAATRCDFAAAVFTNLTQDHLDFHADMEDYFRAKRRLFEIGPGRRRSSTSTIPTGARLAAESRHLGEARSTVSADGSRRRLRARATSRSTPPGRRLQSPVGPTARSRFGPPLPGRLQRRQRARRPRRGRGARRRARGRRRPALAGAGRVPGRFEPVDEGQPFAVLVDYAHTPDSLENVLARRGGSPRDG